MLDKFNDLLSVKDLSQIFNVDRKSIYKEIQKGSFGVPIKMGNKFQIPKAFVLNKYFHNYR